MQAYCMKCRAKREMKDAKLTSSKVESLSLMRSRLTREGALYSCLASFALGGG